MNDVPLRTDHDVAIVSVFDLEQVTKGKKKGDDSTCTNVEYTSQVRIVLQSHICRVPGFQNILCREEKNIRPANFIHPWFLVA